jgi:hypothetical protein
MKLIRRKYLWQAVVMFTWTVAVPVFADFGGDSGNLATFSTNLSTWLSQVISPILLLVGGVKAGWKISHNQPDAWDSAQMWVGGAAFTFLVGAVISWVRGATGGGN